LAGPVFVSRALHTLYGVAATAWMGRVGSDALAAVSTGFFASWTIHAVGDLLVAGVTALVSQSVGARRDAVAGRAGATGIMLAVVLGAALGIAGYFAAPHLFALLFDDPAIESMGATYLSLLSLLAPVLFLVFTFESIFRACGDTRTPMIVLGAGSILNLILDPLLILGWGPFPRLEVRGAVLALAISESLVLLAYGVLAARRRVPLPIPWRGVLEGSAFDLAHARRIVTIGVPHAVTGALFSAIYLFLSRVTGTFGAIPLAALGVVNRLESLNYLTSVAMGMGVAAMVGQNLGGGRLDRAERAAHRGALLITVVTGAMTVVFFVAAEPIVRVFTPGDEAVRVGAHFLRIVALSQVFMGWEIVYGGAFTGAGNTLPPMVAALVTSTIRVPAAFALASPERLGASGVWWTISLTCVVRGLAIMGWFRLGRWKRAFSVPGARGRDETPSSGGIPLSHTPASLEHSPDPHAG
jgi:putative MATE family efflux protein